MNLLSLLSLRQTALTVLVAAFLAACIYSGFTPYTDVPNTYPLGLAMGALLTVAPGALGLVSIPPDGKLSLLTFVIATQSLVLAASESWARTMLTATLLVLFSTAVVLYGSGSVYVLSVCPGPSGLIYKLWRWRSVSADGAVRLWTPLGRSHMATLIGCGDGSTLSLAEPEDGRVRVCCTAPPLDPLGQHVRVAQSSIRIQKASYGARGAFCEPTSLLKSIEAKCRDKLSCELFVDAPLCPTGDPIGGVVKQLEVRYDCGPGPSAVVRGYDYDTVPLSCQF